MIWKGRFAYGTTREGCRAGLGQTLVHSMHAAAGMRLIVCGDDKIAVMVHKKMCDERSGGTVFIFLTLPEGTRSHDSPMLLTTF